MTLDGLKQLMIITLSFTKSLKAAFDGTLPNYEEQKFDRTVGYKWDAGKIVSELQTIVGRPQKRFSQRYVCKNANTTQIFMQGWRSFAEQYKLKITPQKYNLIENGVCTGQVETFNIEKV